MYVVKTSDIFVKNLRRLRKVRFRSQEQFSEKVGLSLRGYQNYEQGVSAPTPDVLDRFAAALGCQPWELTAPETSSPPQYDPDWAELSRVVHSLVHAEPVRRLSALYLLTKDEVYLTQLEAIPDALPFARVLKKIL